MKPTVFTWILAGWGAITFVPLFVAQWILILAPKSSLASDLLIGKGQSWRDQTHFRSALAFAWGDILLLLPALILSYVGILSGQTWGYLIWFALGIVSVYFSILFWVLEKSFTMESYGWFAYYTYYWGFFLYWGIGASVYSAFQLV